MYHLGLLLVLLVPLAIFWPTFSAFCSIFHVSLTCVFFSRSRGRFLAQHPFIMLSLEYYFYSFCFSCGFVLQCFTHVKPCESSIFSGSISLVVFRNIQGRWFACFFFRDLMSVSSRMKSFMSWICFMLFAWIDLWLYPCFTCVNTCDSGHFLTPFLPFLRSIRYLLIICTPYVSFCDPRALPCAASILDFFMLLFNLWVFS